VDHSRDTNYPSINESPDKLFGLQMTAICRVGRRIPMMYRRGGAEKE